MTDTSGNIGSGRGRGRDAARQAGGDAAARLEQERERQRSLARRAREAAARGADPSAIGEASDDSSRMQAAGSAASRLAEEINGTHARRRRRGRIALWVLAFIVPLLSATAGLFLGESMRPRLAMSGGSGLEDPDDRVIFAADKVAHTGRLAVPLDVVAGSRGPVLLLEFDVAFRNAADARSLRRGAGRLRLREAMIQTLTDALNVPKVKSHPDDGHQLALILAAGLRNRLDGVTGVRITRMTISHVPEPDNEGLILPNKMKS